MRGIRFLFRCIKDGTVGWLGGDPPQKSGLIGMAILFVYYLIVSLIIIMWRNENIATNETARLLFVSTVAYFSTLLIGAFLLDFIWHTLLKK